MVIQNSIHIEKQDLGRCAWGSIPTGWGRNANRRANNGNKEASIGTRTLHANCYGLNICVLPKFLGWNPQWDGIWRWDIWEVIRSKGWSSCEWDLFSYKRNHTEQTRPFCHVKTQWEPSRLRTRRWSPDIESSRTLIWDLGFPSL